MRVRAIYATLSTERETIMKKGIFLVILIVLLIFMASSALALQHPFGYRSFREPLYADPWDEVRNNPNGADENKLITPSSTSDGAGFSHEKQSNYSAQGIKLEMLVMDGIFYTVMTLLAY
jgi:hypothetical protein